MVRLSSEEPAEPMKEQHEYKTNDAANGNKSNAPDINHKRRKKELLHSIECKKADYCIDRISDCVLQSPEEKCYKEEHDENKDEENNKSDLQKHIGSNGDMLYNACGKRYNAQKISTYMDDRLDVLGHQYVAGDNTACYKIMLRVYEDLEDIATAMRKPAGYPIRTINGQVRLQLRGANATTEDLVHEALVNLPDILQDYLPDHGHLLPFIRLRAAAIMYERGLSKYNSAVTIPSSIAELGRAIAGQWAAEEAVQHLEQKMPVTCENKAYSAALVYGTVRDYDQATSCHLPIKAKQEDDALSAERAKCVHDALAELNAANPLQGSIAKRVLLDGADQAEVMLEQGISRDVLRGRLFRAKRELRTILERKGADQLM
jgi:DNA-directed RNA polymerase specialized sigma24 family protein